VELWKNAVHYLVVLNFMNCRRVTVVFALWIILWIYINYLDMQWGGIHLLLVIGKKPIIKFF